jgi:alanine-glyoxylate transaminase / serine-glyoxylate transaminase / serine-pyruvate transaminase
MALQEFTPPRRLLLGPGPSLVHPRVLRALSAPLLGHLDPVFLGVMNEIQSSLRRVFETQHPFTIAVSGTGSAGMEASIVNLIEPGDAVLVGVNGVFGTRLASIVDRCGGKAICIEAPWGTRWPGQAPSRQWPSSMQKRLPASANRSKTSAPSAGGTARCSSSMP